MRATRPTHSSEIRRARESAARHGRSALRTATASPPRIRPIAPAVSAYPNRPLADPPRRRPGSSEPFPSRLCSSRRALHHLVALDLPFDTSHLLVVMPLIVDIFLCERGQPGCILRVASRQHRKSRLLL